MNGNFISDGTRAVVLGPCLCPGTPHDEDTAQVLEEVPWDVLVDVELATGGEATRRLVAGTLAAWNLVDEDGDPVPLSFVRRLRADRLDPIADAVRDAYERAKAPLPNGSAAPSRRSRQGSGSPDPTIRPRARRGR